MKLLLDAGAALFGEDVDHATPLLLAKSAGAIGCTVLLARAEASARSRMDQEDCGIEQASV